MANPEASIGASERRIELSDLVDNRLLHFFRGRTGRIRHILHRLLDFPEKDRYIVVETKKGIISAGCVGPLYVGKGFSFNEGYILEKDLLTVDLASPPACSKVYQ